MGIGQMTKVWIVTTGRYSDYEIRRVFSEGRLAEEYVYTFQKDLYGGVRIEEWEVDASFDPSTDVYWRVVITDEESWIDERQEEPPDDPLNEFRGNAVGQWIGWVRARDEEHAIKIGQELVMQEKYQIGMLAGVIDATGGTLR